MDNAKMHTKELVKQIAEDSGFSQSDVTKFLNSYKNIVKKTLSAGEEIRMINFLGLKIIERKAREGRNPQTGKKIKIAASKSIKLRVGKDLKDKINAKKANKNKAVKNQDKKKEGASNLTKAEQKHYAKYKHDLAKIEIMEALIKARRKGEALYPNNEVKIREYVDKTYKKNVEARAVDLDLNLSKPKENSRKQSVKKSKAKKKK